jgi:O-antigen ligase
LCALALQLVPLPARIVGTISPAVIRYYGATRFDAAFPTLHPLTLEQQPTVHALLATFCCFATFWAARALFARGGIRTVVTALAWTAVALVIEAFAQAASGTSLVYGLWHPIDAGARPLGPFINRNHAGTWSLLALFLCLGCLQWRRAISSPSRGWSWRARLAHALNGRSLILMLAVVLLILGVAAGASRSAMLALACAAGYVAAAAPRAGGRSGGSLWTGALMLAAAFAVAAYVDLDRLLSRVDETRQLGLSSRLAIWRDALAVVRDFPLTGTGAGNFSNAMRVYQTGDRTYYWNEAHNHYLQAAAEGGLLLVLPAFTALVALIGGSVRTLSRREHPMMWMWVGASAALVAVAVKSIWETGLTLPANGMLAAVAAAILLHGSPRQSHASTGD